MEERLDERERSLQAVVEEKRLQVGALKAALAGLTGRLLFGDAALEAKELLSKADGAPADLSKLLKSGATVNIDQVKGGGASVSFERGDYRYGR